MDKFDYKQTVTVYDSSKNRGESIPDGLADAIAWLQSKLDSIPPEHREAATLELRTEVFYDSSSVAMEIEYSRPPTPEEIESRRRRAVENARKRADDLKQQAERAEQAAARLSDPIKGSDNA